MDRLGLNLKPGAKTMQTLEQEVAWCVTRCDGSPLSLRACLHAHRQHAEQVPSWDPVSPPPFHSGED